jgi:hypothetical protein
MSSEACADEAVLGEVPKLARSDRQGRNLITRYWGEAIVVAIALLVWMPRLSGPIDLRWDAGVYYLLGTSLAQGHGYRIRASGSPEACSIRRSCRRSWLHQGIGHNQRGCGSAVVEKIMPCSS